MTASKCLNPAALAANELVRWRRLQSGCGLKDRGGFLGVGCLRSWLCLRVKEIVRLSFTVNVLIHCSFVFPSHTLLTAVSFFSP